MAARLLVVELESERVISEDVDVCDIALEAYPDETLPTECPNGDCCDYLRPRYKFHSHSGKLPLCCERAFYAHQVEILSERDIVAPLGTVTKIHSFEFLVGGVEIEAAEPVLRNFIEKQHRTVLEAVMLGNDLFFPTERKFNAESSQLWTVQPSLPARLWNSLFGEAWVINSQWDPILRQVIHLKSPARWDKFRTLRILPHLRDHLTAYCALQKRDSNLKNLCVNSARVLMQRKRIDPSWWADHVATTVSYVLQWMVTRSHLVAKDGVVEMPNRAPSGRLTRQPGRLGISKVMHLETDFS